MSFASWVTSTASSFREWNSSNDVFPSYYPGDRVCCEGCSGEGRLCPPYWCYWRPSQSRRQGGLHHWWGEFQDDPKVRGRSLHEYWWRPIPHVLVIRLPWWLILTAVVGSGIVRHCHTTNDRKFTSDGIYGGKQAQVHYECREFTVALVVIKWWGSLRGASNWNVGKIRFLCSCLRREPHYSMHIFKKGAHSTRWSSNSIMQQINSTALVSAV